jgi:hypothetical protein
MPGKWPQGQRGDKVLQDLDRVQLGSHRYRQRSAQHEHAEDETGLGHEGGRACAIAISRKAVCAERSSLLKIIAEYSKLSNNCSIHALRTRDLRLRNQDCRSQDVHFNQVLIH